MVRKANQTLAVERPQTTADATGAPTLSGHVPIHTGVACWRQPANARVQDVYFRRGITITHRIFVDTELDVQAGDRLVVTLADGTEVKHKALGAPEDMAGLGRAWRLDAEQRTNED